MLGIINNVLFNDNFSKIEWIEFFDDNNDFEYIISAKNIFYIDDAVIIKNCDCVLNATTVAFEKRNPVNFSVFSTTGKNFGKIVDVELDDKLCVHFFVLQNESKILPNQILNIGKNVTILQPEKSVKISNFKTKHKIPVQNIQNSVVKIENIHKNKITNPKKILTDNYSFLIGRKLDKNIYAENKQLIAKKQTVITSHIIDIASKHGKLKELTNSSIL